MRVLGCAVGVGIGLAVFGEERSLRATSPQRVGDTPTDLGPTCEQLGQFAIVHRGAGLVVQHTRADPVAEKHADLVADRRQGVQQVGLAWLDEGAGRGHQGAEAPRRDLNPEARGHDLFELVRLVEDHHVVFGRDDAAAGEMRPVEVGVHHDDIGDRSPFSGGLGEAAPARRAVVGAGAFPWADTDHVPGPVGGLKLRSARSPVWDFCDHATNLRTSSTMPSGGELWLRPALRHSPRPAPARRPVHPGRRARPGSRRSPLRPPAAGRRSCYVLQHRVVERRREPQPGLHLG